VTELGGIEIVRKRAPWRDRGRAYKIILDGSKVGKIRNGQTINLPVSPGRHGLRLKVDWVGSDVLTFYAGGDEVVRFECEPNGTAVTGLWDVISWFLRSGKPWVSLRRVSGIRPDG
jgi:hypothetical protein